MGNGAVKPAKTKPYQFAQSKHPQLPEIPFRAIVAASSGAGKTVLLQSMVLDPIQDAQR